MPELCQQRSAVRAVCKLDGGKKDLPAGPPKGEDRASDSRRRDALIRSRVHDGTGVAHCAPRANISTVVY
jgi:hypothetical protein